MSSCSSVFYDQAANSIFVADTDYLESADTREIDGVYYPVWGERRLHPGIRVGAGGVCASTMASDSRHGLFAPQSYGRHRSKQAIYTVDGTYTFADGGEPATHGCILATAL